ncbi:SCO family protein [Janthinobacterium sp. 17J80-10]|uniref:SCO family protein n=1 Tax=Janthinobacterium sp. 17J80-10 TaxID=2497863 RepID=UPI0013E8A157|nr:SCO family protein [Janthinobacterium sp. 17J80-10]
MALAASTISRLAHSHALVGAIRPPLALPAIKLVRHDGAATDLHTQLRGKTTALQFMFTGCSQTCSLQGALFAAVQHQLPANVKNNVQFLSVSIDPLGDDARALSAWLRQFGAGPNWVAALPTVKELDQLRTALQIRNDGPDSHTGQVFLIDRQGLLVWGTEDLPPVEVVLRQLVNIARA